MPFFIITFITLSLVFSHVVNAKQYDPMAPPGQQPGMSSKSGKNVKKEYRYRLRQIVINEQGNSAIINGRVLKVGEYIHRAKVVKIEANKVTLEKSGRFSVIQLNRPVNKVRQ